MKNTQTEPIKFPPLPFRVPIRIDDVEPAVFATDDEGRMSDGTWRKTIVDPDTGFACFYVKLAPGSRATPHWHPSNTIYFVHKGTLVIDGEDEYHTGDVRLVQGGFAYGWEGAGDDGCEFVFVSLGEYGKFDPDEDDPPLGRWDA
jgi:quercetin dioxygenase-like cupin family protein